MNVAECFLTFSILDPTNSSDDRNFKYQNIKVLGVTYLRTSVAWFCTDAFCSCESKFKLRVSRNNFFAFAAKNFVQYRIFLLGNMP